MFISSFTRVFFMLRFLPYVDFGIKFHARYLTFGVISSSLPYTWLGSWRIHWSAFISLLGIRYGYRVYISY